MDWKNAKMLLVSTATIVVASQVVRKAYTYFFGAKSSATPETDSNEAYDELLSGKNRDINDVIVFSNDTIQRQVKVPPNKDYIVCQSRELNCFKLIKYLKSARETLDVCMYLITSNQIAEQIIRLGTKHVLVRIIVDGDTAFTPSSQIKKLKEYSFIQVQSTQKSILMHHKFCIIDGPKAIARKNILKAHAEKLNIVPKKPFVKPVGRNKPVRSFVMSGSLNWSTQAMVSNNESVIVTSHENIVGKFEKEFETLWVEDDPVLMTTSQYDKHKDAI